MLTFLAAINPPPWVGAITPPMGAGYDDPNSGLVVFTNNAFKLVFLGFGFYALINFIMAAYNYLNAQGDPKKIEKAGKLITQTLIGLLLLSTTFIFAGIIGQVFFGNWYYLLDPVTTINTI